MNVTCSVLQLLAAACVGVFAGAMLTEGFVLVPWWRSLEPADFFSWYAANDRRLLGFFGPVTAVAAIASLAAAVVATWTGHPGRWASVVAAALVLVTVGMFSVYFEAANASFSAASIAPGELAGELSRWAAWHDVRSLLAVAALGASMLAVSTTRS